MLAERAGPGATAVLDVFKDKLIKRNQSLNRKAITIAKQIAKLDSKSARWIAKDALKELEGEPVQGRLREKSNRAKK